MRKLILPILAMLASTPAFGEEEAKAPAAPAKETPAKDSKAPAPAKDEKKEEPAKDEPVCPAGTTEKGNRCVEIPTDGRN